ncbi:MAG: DUF3795 domain-containing protein, partial [Bacteroidia bacterium]|nr:DUF3795 domain-containing protein [Bacteroidia bacterium]
LRIKTAEKWKIEYNSPDITPEMINCTGCREQGSKIGHWNECQIRNCAKSKRFQTCGNCTELEKCQTVAFVHKYVPEAVANLKSLN